jgi:outer membrane murein-binding lipoprotein Lpp
MLYKKPLLHLSVIIIILPVLFLSGCISPKDKVERATLLKTEDATQELLQSEVNRFAKVNSMRAKMDLKFEDNSFAELGIAEKYKTADGEVVVQRPANILLKVQVPIIKTDVAQMTSNGEKFCVAVLEDGAGGKYKKFVCGTNSADYSLLQQEVEKIGNGDAKVLKQNINAFSNLRPQHFTEAILVRPIDTTNNYYTQSSIFQEEFDINAQKKSPLRWVLRGYYLLDEMHKNDNGTLTLARRFWFDRVGGIRLARQQIFDAKGEIESDIVYGKPGNLTETGEYNNLPLRIEVTRPKERYKMSLTYQTPNTVSIGKTYPAKAFILQNDRNLPEVNLDQKLEEVKSRSNTSVNQKVETGNP